MKCYIENYTQPFDIDTGAVYCDNFNEKLDSMNINISHLSTPIQFIKFQYFYVYSTISGFAKHFVLDNFTENIVNLNCIKHYNYAIQLASETKLLEKWVCPNRTVLHSLSETKTIKQVINEFLTLYVPKVKVRIPNTDTWQYDYAISWSMEMLDSFFGDTLCPDISMQHPTLRQVITTLSLVLAKIPKIENRTLTFIDFRQATSDFEIPENIIFDKQEANSSDVFTTTLKTPLRNTLDDNNIIRNDVIGFRDSNNVFLKQKSNLILTTDFGIEKIKKLEVNVYKDFYLMFNGTNDIDRSYGVVDFGINQFRYLEGGYYDAQSHGYKGTYFELYMCDNACDFTTGTGVRYYSGTPKFVQTVLVPNGVTTYDLTSYLGQFSFFILHTDILEYNSSMEPIGHTYTVYHSLAIVSKTPNTDERISMPIKLNPIDLTPIVKEKQIRNQLDVNYLNVVNPVVVNGTMDVSPLADNYYTTLEYTYKDTKISGFSNTWSWVAFYVGNIDEVLFDRLNVFLQTNLPNYDSANYESQRDSLIPIILNLYKTDVIVNFSYTKVDEPVGLYISNHTVLSPYASATFNIEYIPFNEISFETNKAEELPIEYKDYDTQENTIVMLDDFSAKEFDKVQRLGNNIIQYSQSLITDLSYANELNSKDTQGNIIFSREIEFYENDDNTKISHYNVSYTATKNYVLKNYFTALQNKYRAYEYSSTEKATLRQELRKSYVAITTGNRRYYNCDYNFDGSFLFIVSPFINNFEPLKYAIVGDEAHNFYKYDLSIVGDNNSIIFSHIEPYANHYGIKIAYDNEQLYDDPITINVNENGTIKSVDINIVSQDNRMYLGGVIQEWIPHSSNYKTKHIMGYSSQDLFYYTNNRLYTLNTTKQLPKVNINSVSEDLVFYLAGEDNFANYYSNVGERLSDCSQFIYYLETPNVEITKNFTNLHRLNGSHNMLCLVAYSETKPTLYEKSIVPHTPIATSGIFTLYDYAQGVSVNIPLNQINETSGYLYMYYTDGIYYYDLMSVEIKQETIYQNNVVINFSLNSTKTLRVYEKGDVWQLDRYVKPNADFELN